MSAAPEPTVREGLRGQPLPGEAEAAARSWPVVEAALEARLAAGAASRRRRLLPRLALVAGLAGCAFLAAFTPAGAWLEDRFDEKREPSPPGFAPLPPGGSVLTINRTGAYAVDAEGGSQRLGSFSEAAWSPRGRHVVGSEGRRLVAVTPTGTPKWTLVRPHRVHHPAWSRDEGFAVAYLEGSALRVIAGNGDPATHRVVRRGVAPVTPAWRVGSDTFLTYATADGAIETVDVTTGATLWRTRLAGAVRGLAAAPGGRVVALTPRAVTVLGPRGYPVLRARLSGSGQGLAVDPRGRRAAVSLRQGGEIRVVEVPLGFPTEEAGVEVKPLFQGDVDGIAWAGDGLHLLVGWRGADQWLLFDASGNITALHDVTRELGAAGGFPRVVSWCCPR